MPDLADSITGLLMVEDNCNSVLPAPAYLVDMIFWSLNDYSIRDNVHMKIVLASFSAYMVGLVRHSLNSSSSYVEIHGIHFHPGPGLSRSCVSNGMRGRVFWFCSCYPWLINVVRLRFIKVEKLWCKLFKFDIDLFVDCMCSTTL